MSTYDYGSYFDPSYYLQNNPDVRAAGVDPRTHFDQFGYKEGRNPSAYFDTSDYLGQYTDVANAGVNPLEHYLQFGRNEGRMPIGGTSPLFDPSYYLKQNPDVAAANVDPATHYSTYGYKEGRDPGPGFDTTSYYKANPDVAAAFVNPLSHYGTFGQAEGRSPYVSGGDVGGAFGGGTPVGGPVLPSFPIVPHPGPGGVFGDTPAGLPPPGSQPNSPAPPVSPAAPDYTALRRALGDTARTNITNLFNTRGATTSKHSQAIEDRIARTMAGIPDTDLQDEGLFTGIPEQLYGELESGYRNKALGEFNTLLGSNTSGLDDSIIESILSEQRAPANRFVSSMLGRGQINDFGAGRAREELDRQESIGRTNLNTTGQGLIDTGLGTARSTFGDLGLDKPYDPNATSNDFMFGLGSQLRSGAGNVFSTAGLPAVAGASTGAFSASKSPFRAKTGGGRTPGGGIAPADDDENVLF